MSDMHAAGTFTGKIIGTEFEQDGQEADGLVLVFHVKLDDGEEVTCKHRTHGPYAHICKGIIGALGLAWPAGVLDIDSLVGTEVPIRIKHKAGKNGNVFVNSYIDLGGGGNAPATPNFVKAAVAKMAEAAPDDNTPF